jgi:hypothetical protein
MAIKMPVGMSMLVKSMGIDPDVLATQVGTVMQSVESLAAHLKNIDARLTRIEEKPDINLALEGSIISTLDRCIALLDNFNVRLSRIETVLSTISAQYCPPLIEQERMELKDG